MTFGDILYRYDRTPGGIELIRYNGKEETVDIPEEIDGEKVLKIGSVLFSNAKVIKNVTIPNGVTELAFDAFSGCNGLTSIEIPNSVTEIGEMAFYSCKALESITILDSVTNIGKDAFKDCTAAITYKGNTYTSDNYSELYTE